MPNVPKKTDPQQVTHFADMFSAMGAEPRLRIMQLLLSAHPDGMIVGDISDELDIPGSTLSHHLDKLKNENLVKVRRESTFAGSGERRSAADAFEFSLCRMLYAEQGNRAACSRKA